MSIPHLPQNYLNFEFESSILKVNKAVNISVHYVNLQMWDGKPQNDDYNNHILNLNQLKYV